MPSWLSSPYWWTLVGFAATALHIAYFLRMPVLAEAIARRGDTARARRLLLRVVKTPSLLGNLLKVNALYQLVALEMADGLYDAALPHLHTLLRVVSSDKTAPGLEYELRSKLAQCLEKTGSSEAALEERARAEYALESAPETPMTLLAKGQMLEKQFRFSEACAALERALSLPFSWNADARAEALANLGNAAYNAGRADETIRWGEAALAEEPERPALREMAHVIAGLGHSSQGNLDEAERHRAAALALATAAQAEERAGQYRLQLASIALKRGKIAEAHRVAEGFLVKTDSTPQLRRDAAGIVVECLRAWGRYDEAIARITEMNVETVYQPPLEQRFRGIVALFTASLHAERNDSENAQTALTTATDKISRDERLGIACRGLAVWVSALSGKWEQSRTITTQVETQLPSASHDREAHLGCLHFLARGAMVRREWGKAKGYWQTVLEGGPDPLTRPTALYFLAECCANLGETERAQTLYREATDTNLDTYYARLSADALNAPS